MRRINVFLMIFLVTICIVGCQKKETTTMDLSLQEADVSKDVDEMQDTIFVYVCGAVCEEGVYELPVGSRMYEAIELAGGFRQDASTTEINQAEVLVDAMKIYVPTVQEILERQSQTGGKINLNWASKEELMTLPGVGASKAESIIRYRQESGNFQKIEDIMEISGIKEGLFEQIKDLIEV